jgi:hypothetical protein
MKSRSEAAKSEAPDEPMVKGIQAAVYPMAMKYKT